MRGDFRPESLPLVMMSNYGRNVCILIIVSRVDEIKLKKRGTCHMMQVGLAES